MNENSPLSAIHRDEKLEIVDRTVNTYALIDGIQQEPLHTFQWAINLFQREVDG